MESVKELQEKLQRLDFKLAVLRDELREVSICPVFTIVPHVVKKQIAGVEIERQLCIDAIITRRVLDQQESSGVSLYS
jgi:hypothetical protein